MSHPREAWKFKLWSEAMLRGATVKDPEYKGKSKSSSRGKPLPKRRRRRGSAAMRRKRAQKKVT